MSKIHHAVRALSRNGPDNTFLVDMRRWYRMCGGTPYAEDYHHRKAEVHGGGDTHKNILRVTRIEHVAFNAMFGNGSPTPEELVRKLNSYASRLLPRFRNGAQSRAWCSNKKNQKTIEAWVLLFDDNALSQIVAKLNLWIDPGYRIYIGSHNDRQTAFLRRR